MFENIIAQIEKYNSIVIFGHINPDGDCYGSQVGLREIILALYPHKKVYLAGRGLPKFFKLLPPTDEISDEVIANSLAIIVDANDVSRLEDQRAEHALAFAKIDHHIDTGSFKDGPSYVDTRANSACDIIAALAMECNIKLNRIGATALYMGILTDSARFQFVTDYESTFVRAKYLIDCGADTKAINEVLSRTDEKTLAAKGYILSHYQKTKEGVIYIVYDKETLKKLDLSANAASNMINLLGNVEGYPIWASFAEYEDGKVRVELRSNGPAIQPCAVRIGGGGHALASGAQLEKLDYKEVEEIVNDLGNTLNKWREEN